MTDEYKLKNAKTVFATMCSMFDKNDWRYEKDEEKLTAQFNVSGEDIPMRFVAFIDVDRQLIRVISVLPFKFAEDKRVEGAIATCQANYKIADGSFDYNFDDGTVVFRMTTSFRDSLISEDLIGYMIQFSCLIVDKYNDRFLMISKGLLKIEDFFLDN